MLKLTPVLDRFPSSLNMEMWVELQHDWANQISWVITRARQLTFLKENPPQKNTRPMLQITYYGSKYYVTICYIIFYLVVLTQNQMTNKSLICHWSSFTVAMLSVLTLAFCEKRCHQPTTYRELLLLSEVQSCDRRKTRLYTRTWTELNSD